MKLFKSISYSLVIISLAETQFYAYVKFLSSQKTKEKFLIDIYLPFETFKNYKEKVNMMFLLCGFR